VALQTRPAVGDRRGLPVALVDPPFHPVVGRLGEGDPGAGQLQRAAPCVGEDRLQRLVRQPLVEEPGRRRARSLPLRAQQPVVLAVDTVLIGRAVLDQPHRPTAAHQPLGMAADRWHLTADHGSESTPLADRKPCPERCPELGTRNPIEPEKTPRTLGIRTLGNQHLPMCHAEGRGFESLQPLVRTRRTSPMPRDSEASGTFGRWQDDRPMRRLSKGRKFTRPPRVRGPTPASWRERWARTR